MISLRNDSNSLRGSGLVKKSAKFLRLSTYSTLTSPDSTSSRILSSLRRMCFVLSCMTGSSATRSAAVFDERLDRRDALLDVVVVVGVLVRQHLGQRVVVLDGVLQRAVELARQSHRQVLEELVDLGRDEAVRHADVLVAHVQRDRLGLALRARPDGAHLDDVEEVLVLLRRGPQVAEPLVELPLGALFVGRNHQLVRRRQVVVMSRGSLPRRHQL
mmetsp:Transcript_45040/g.146467  ORF Transcript_45040/g.146467 Transcript_45040/m.146467 type:complete len:216 (+) Transcript_45040:459-1106(+)